MRGTPTRYALGNHSSLAEIFGRNDGGQWRLGASRRVVGLRVLSFEDKSLTYCASPRRGRLERFRRSTGKDSAIKDPTAVLMVAGAGQISA